MEGSRRRFSIMIGAIVLSMLVAIILGSILPPFIIIFISFAILGAAYFYVIRSVFRRSGSRYDDLGQRSMTQQALGRIGVLFIIGAVFFSILSRLLLTGPSLIITLVTVGGVVIVIDRRVGRDLEKELQQKREHERLYIKALGKGEGKCMSCLKPLDPEELFCPHCGFQQRKIEEDKDYIKK